MDFNNVESILQRVRLEQYRDNVEGALHLLDRARAAFPAPEYQAVAERIRSALGHLTSRQAYEAAYETFYWKRKGRTSLKHIERNIRVALGFKTRKITQRFATHPEFERLEYEILRARAKRVLDAGSGEGTAALTIAARHQGVRVEGIEISRTNLTLARRMNRFPNLAFHHGFLEDAPDRFGPGVFDLVYSLAVLEHVTDLEKAVAAILAVLRPGGRFCFVVPMNEFAASGFLPEVNYDDGVAGHVRVFTEEGLRARFGACDDFYLEKLPGDLPKKYPPTIVPVEFGSFFVAFSKPR